MAERPLIPTRVHLCYTSVSVTAISCICDAAVPAACAGETPAPQGSAFETIDNGHSSQ